MIRELNFDIHGLFRFKATGTNERLLNILNRNYSYFKTDEDIKSDLNIILSDFEPVDGNSFIVDHKYIINSDSIFAKDSHKTVRWQFLLRDLEDTATLHFSGNLFSEIFLRDYLLEPLIGFKLAQKGYSLLHASGVMLNNKGIVFAACKGVGKTSTILNLAQKNASYMSNEPIVISNDGLIYSWPTYISFYHYNLMSSPHFSNKLKIRDILELKTKHLIYLLSLKYGSLPLNLSPEIMFKSVGETSPLDSLIILTKTTGDKIKIIENLNCEIVAEKLLSVNRFEYKYFSDILTAYSYVFPKSNAKNFWQILRGNFLAFSQRAKCYEIEIPKRYDPLVFEKIYEYIREN